MALLVMVIPEFSLASKFADLARTPPLGWNSWNAFRCNINESVIRQNAEKMVATGMRDAGFQYVIVDDCWQATARDASGQLAADPVRFPSGIKALADYVHALGLKFGIYSDAGPWTCQGLPGSDGHESEDAKTFANWGVDYLKYDRCYTLGRDVPKLYAKMAQAIVDAKRPILFAICNWGHQEAPLWAPDVGHTWRTTWDILNHWRSVLWILDTSSNFGAVARPGQWNDPDMLQVGNGRMSFQQDQSHFALWAMMAAPLIAGNDLRSMNAQTTQILTNKQIIDINQDRLGQQGTRIGVVHGVEIWSKEIEGNEHQRAMLFFNRGSLAAELDLSVAHFGYKPETAASVAVLGDIQLRDGRLVAKFEAHESKVVVLSGSIIPLDGQEHWLEDLVPSYEANGKGAVGIGESSNGNTLQMDSMEYVHGLGLHAPAKLRYRLNKQCHAVTGIVGIDDEAGQSGAVQVRVYGDSRLLWESRRLTGNGEYYHLWNDETPHSEPFELDINGVDVLEFNVVPLDGTTHYTHTDLADVLVKC